MQRAFAVFAIAWCALAQTDVKVTYVARQASVQDIAMTMARQAGLRYNWQKSFDQTNPRCRQFANDVRIEALPFDAAMRQILLPAGLRYLVENGEVVLYRAPDAPLAPPADPIVRLTRSGPTSISIRHIIPWRNAYTVPDPDPERPTSEKLTIARLILARYI